MKTRVPALILVVAVIFSIGGTSVFATPPKDPQPVSEETKAAPGSVSTIKEKNPAADKLSRDMLKLVGDAKAGKVAPRVQQFPNTKRNNLSTGAKIGIIAAIGGVIATLIIINHITND